jgi:hypothetical protein
MATETYDSTPDTETHIGRVRGLLDQVAENLDQRAYRHDASKLEEPEKSAFDRETPLLRDLTYGSDDYKAALKRLGVALEHHYAENSHHPEHYSTGIRGMSLLDVVEMLIDWKAATERHADGDITSSIEKNQERFGYSDDLKAIFHNTVKEMGW